MIRYKINVLDALKKNGFSSYDLRKNKLIGERTIQQLRQSEIVSWKTVDTICGLLQCQPGDLVEYIKETGE